MKQHAHAHAHIERIVRIVEKLRLLRTYGEEPRNSNTRSSDIIISDKTKCDIQIEMFLHFLINTVEDIHGRQLMHVKCIECDLLSATRCDIPVSYGLYWFLAAAKYAKNWKREKHERT